MQIITLCYIADCGYIDMDCIAMQVWDEINPDIHPLETVGYKAQDIPDDSYDWAEGMYNSFAKVMNEFKARLDIVEKEFVEDGNADYQGEDVPDPCPVYNLTISISEAQ